MVTTTRGRPRSDDIEAAALDATTALLEEQGYESLRMKDVAARAGVGLGALYRRWSGKQELVMAALRTGPEGHGPELGPDPVDDLVSALLRISAAVDQGLNSLAAACLRDPASEIAGVAREAKLMPMTRAVQQYLKRCTGPADDLTARAEIGPAFILWRAASTGVPPDEGEIRSQLLPLMGVTVHRRD